jgi:cytochrome P450
MSCGTFSCHHGDPAEKETTSSRYRFPKPVHHYGLLLYFGSNIVASDGEEWKRFRKIAAPAFSDVRHLVQRNLGIVADICYPAQ